MEALDARTLPNGAAVLYTGDTMGVIKVWEITKDDGTPPRWQSKLEGELNHHRTRVDDMVYGNGHLWTGERLPDLAVFHSYPWSCSVHRRDRPHHSPPSAGLRDGHEALPTYRAPDSRPRNPSTRAQPACGAIPAHRCG